METSKMKSWSVIHFVILWTIGVVLINVIRIGHELTNKRSDYNARKLELITVSLYIFLMMDPLLPLYRSLQNTAMRCRQVSICGFSFFFITLLWGMWNGWTHRFLSTLRGRRGRPCSLAPFRQTQKVGDLNGSRWSAKRDAMTRSEMEREGARWINWKPENWLRNKNVFRFIIGPLGRVCYTFADFPPVLFISCHAPLRKP